MKLKSLLIFLISVVPMILFGQTYKDVYPNQNFKGYVKVDSTKFKVGDTPLTENKIKDYDATVINMADTVSLTDITILPLIFSAAGDTSNYPIPGKIGNIFIDTQSSKIYISKSAVRNGWVILN